MRRFLFALALCVSLPVVAGGAALAAKPARAPRAKQAGAAITFTGYRELPQGRGIVFVEISEQVPVEVKRSGRIIEYKLVGARVPLRNNRNPLALRDFPSSALRAVLVPQKNAVKLVVTLRADVSPTHRMVAHGNGAVLEVQLPPLPSK